MLVYFSTFGAEIHNQNSLWNPKTIYKHVLSNSKTKLKKFIKLQVGKLRAEIFNMVENLSGNLNFVGHSSTFGAEYRTKHLPFKVRKQCLTTSNITLKM